MSVWISDMDRGFKEVKRQLAAANVKPYVKIGVQGKEAEERKEARTPEGGIAPTGMSVVDIATIHEFGYGNNPARSFLRDTVDDKRRQYMRIAEILSGEVIDGKRDALSALNLLGEKIKADVVQRISDGIPPPLKPETIARKNEVVGGGLASTPLIDTGQLRQSITYAVERKGKGAA